MQGIPVSSSGSRTAIGDAVGQRTQLGGLVTVLCTLLALLTLGPVLAAFPVAGLAAVVVYAATRLVDVRELVRFGRFRTSELVLALATTVSVLVLDVLLGIVAAIALSVLDLLRRVARPHDAVLGIVPGLAGMHDVDDYPSAQVVPGLMIYRYDSPLFFANAEDFRTARTGLGRRGGDAGAVVRAQRRGGLRGRHHRRGRARGAAQGARPPRHRRRHRPDEGGAARGSPSHRVPPARPEDRIFATLPTTVEAYQEWVRQRPTTA